MALQDFREHQLTLLTFQGFFRQARDAGLPERGGQLLFHGRAQVLVLARHEWLDIFGINLVALSRARRPSRRLAATHPVTSVPAAAGLKLAAARPCEHFADSGVTRREDVDTPAARRLLAGMRSGDAPSPAAC